MAGRPEFSKGKAVCFSASFQAAVETPPPFPWKPSFCGRCYQGAELGGAALPPVCSGSGAGSDHSHPLTSLFLFSPPLPCPLVLSCPEPYPGARTPAWTSAWTAHRECGLRSVLRGLRRRAHLPGPPLGGADWPLLGHIPPPPGRVLGPAESFLCREEVGRSQTARKQLRRL